MSTTRKPTIDSHHVFMSANARINRGQNRINRKTGIPKVERTTTKRFSRTYILGLKIIAIFFLSIVGILKLTNRWPKY